MKAYNDGVNGNMYLYFQIERDIFTEALLINPFPMDDYNRAYSIFARREISFRQRVEDLLGSIIDVKDKFTGIEDSSWNKPWMVFYALQGTLAKALSNERSRFYRVILYLFADFESQKSFLTEKDSDGVRTLIHANVTIDKALEYFLVFSVMAYHKLKWTSQVEYVRTGVKNIMSVILGPAGFNSQKSNILQAAVNQRLVKREEWVEPPKRTQKR